MYEFIVYRNSLPDYALVDIVSPKGYNKLLHPTGIFHK